MEIKWYNTESGEWPYHGQTVILTMDGNYHITVYNAVLKKFVMTIEPFTDFETTRNITWTDFKP